MNLCAFTGRIAKTPVVSVGSNGSKVWRTKFALSDDYVKDNAERQGTFINIVAFGDTANLLTDTLKIDTGDFALIRCHIVPDDYTDSNNNRVFGFDFIIERYECLETREQKQQRIAKKAAAQQAPYGQQPPYNQQPAYNQAPPAYGQQQYNQNYGNQQAQQNKQQPANTAPYQPNQYPQQGTYAAQGYQGQQGAYAGPGYQGQQGNAAVQQGTPKNQGYWGKQQGNNAGQQPSGYQGNSQAGFNGQANQQGNAQPIIPGSSFIQDVDAMYGDEELPFN